MGGGGWWGSDGGWWGSDGAHDPPIICLSPSRRTNLPSISGSLVRLALWGLVLLLVQGLEGGGVGLGGGGDQQLVCASWSMLWIYIECS